MADGLLDAQGHGHPANPLSGRRHIIEHTTHASVLISIQERVRQVQRQSWRVARNLDARYPGSTFEQELNSYGIYGALCVLVSGPFGSLSEDSNHVVDLIVRSAWLEKRKMNPGALSTRTGATPRPVSYARMVSAHHRAILRCSY